MSVIFSQCLDCKNYKGRRPDGSLTCSAYPEGIPEDILWNRHDHTKHFDGDNGIKFEPIN